MRTRLVWTAQAMAFLALFFLALPAPAQYWQNHKTNNFTAIPPGYQPTAPGLWQNHPTDGYVAPGYYSSPYNNGPYYHYYNYTYGSPYGAQVFTPLAPLEGGYYQATTGNTTFRFWRAPSGYYYPWYYSPNVAWNYWGYAVPLRFESGNASPQKPPLSTVISDMSSYLEEGKRDGRLSDSNYESLKTRLHDLKRMADSAEMTTDGDISEDADREIRNGLNDLAKQMSYLEHS